MAQIKQIERLIRILQRLSMKHETTVDELYRYFEGGVSKRTLERDLIELSSANLPLVTRQGKGKQLVWLIDPGYLKFIPATLQIREITAAAFLRTFSGLFRGTPLQKDAEDFFAKVRQLYPVDVIAEIDDARLDNVFGFSWTGYIDYRPFAPILGRLLEAITQRKVVTFHYKPHWKESESVFDGNPYMILFHKGALYAVVHVPKFDNYIFLPVQRIRDIVLSDKPFKRDKGFSLDKLREGRFGIWGFEGQKPQKVVLKFSKDIAQIVAERVWHPTQKLTHHRDGSLTLEMRVVISDELRAWVASWLGYVEVVSPSYLTKGNNRE